MAELGCKPWIVSANKDHSTLLWKKSLRTELSIDKDHLQENGESYNEPISEVDYVYKKKNRPFPSIYNRLVVFGMISHTELSQ